MSDELLNLLALPVSSLCCACRLCAAVIDASSAVSIFDKESDIDLMGKINKYLPITVEETDPFPKTICKHCLELLVKFHDLSQKCLQFDEHLQRTLDHCVPEEIDVEAELKVGLQCLDTNTNIPFDLEELDYLESKLPANNEPELQCGACCKVCGEKLYNFDCCLQHQKAHILSNKDCVVCGYKNVSDLEINTHLSKHFGGQETGIIKNRRSEDVILNTIKKNCLKCDKVLNNADFAVEHCKSHRPTDTSSYNCVLCQTTVTVTELETHMCHHFTTVPCSLSCDACQKDYPDEKSLKYHRCIKLQKYKCSQCKLGFKSEARLRFHEEFHLYKRTYCDICKKDFKFESRIYIHMTGAHNGERDNPFCCDKCGKTFRWLRALHAHEMTHSGERPFACLKCEARFSSKSSLVSHKSCHESAQRLHCLRCDYTSCRKLKLLQHVQRFHKQVDASQSVVRCQACNEVFPNMYHMELESHAHNDSDGTYLIEEIVVSKLFQCERCDKSYASVEHLSEHRLKHIGDDSFCLYKCRLCDMGFRKHDLMMRHQRVHSNITSQYSDKLRVLIVNSCNLCGIECVDYIQLLNHKERSNCSQKTLRGEPCRRPATM